MLPHPIVLHLPPQDSRHLTTHLRVTGIDNPTAIRRLLTDSVNRPLHCTYDVSETGDLLVTVYACDVANWSNDTYWVAFNFRGMLFEIVTPRAFHFPANPGEEPTLEWGRTVQIHEAPKIFTENGPQYALGMR